MPLNDQGFAIISLPPSSQEILDSYENCPLDPYMGNQTRYKRFDQYRLTWVDGNGWTFELLPHRAYTAYKKFNPVGGGMKRSYEPLEVDFRPWVKIGAEHLELDTTEDWQINVHQNRTKATPEKPGLLTPEGPHHDGHEYIMIAVLRRHSVTGGETRLWRPGADEPFWNGTLQPGQAALLDDRAIKHDATDLLPENGSPGHRDILIVAFSRWEERWYGDKHDDAVLAGGAEAPAAT